jgi:hypothetical protein
MAYVEIPRSDIDTLLRYAKEEYEYLVYRKASELPEGLAENEFWALELTLDSAKSHIKKATDAYDNIPDYQFGCCKIERTTLTGWISKKKNIRTKPRVSFSLINVKIKSE